MSTNGLIIIDNIQSRIFTVRGVQVMLDADLAALYNVETRVLNQAVKRNKARFPEQFCFQLTGEEYERLRSQTVTLEKDGSLTSQDVTLESQRGKHRKYLPYAFTEQGVAMLSAVLRSDVAVEISVKIMDDNDLYHFGASLKDLGKKWFAFSKMDMGAVDMLARLEGSYA